MKKNKEKKGWFFSREKVSMRIIERLNEQIIEMNDYLDLIGFDPETGTVKYPEKADEYALEHCSSRTKRRIEKMYKKHEKFMKKEAKKETSTPEEEVEEIMNVTNEAEEECEDTNTSEDSDALGKFIDDNQVEDEEEHHCDCGCCEDDECDEQDECDEDEEEYETQAEMIQRIINNFAKKNEEKSEVNENPELEANTSTAKSKGKKIRYVKGDVLKNIFDIINQDLSIDETINKLNELGLGMKKDPSSCYISANGRYTFGINGNRFDSIVLLGEAIMQPHLSEATYRSIASEIGINMASKFRNIGLMGSACKAKKNNGKEYGLNISISEKSIMLALAF